MTKCPPDKPWCLTHGPSLGVSKGKRGPSLERECFATQEEAENWAIEHMPHGHAKLEIFMNPSE